VENVSYEDEIYLLTLVLQELHHGVELELHSTRFIDRFQADVALLDEAISDHHAALCGNAQLPGRLGHLRDLHRIQVAFAATLATLERGENPLGRALAPLRETLGALQRRHAELARATAAVLAEAGEGRPEQPVVSDEEFRILLADEDAAE
jgi:hypothetical protein